MSSSPAPTRTSAALRLREGRAPIRERLTAMLFLTALLHAIVILGVGFGSGLHLGQDSPQLDVLLVTSQVPEARSNEQAQYLAQRTQHGAGNTQQRTPPGSPASRGAIATAPEARAGDALRSRDATPMRQDERLLTTTAAAPEVSYFGQAPDERAAAAMPEMLADTPGAPRSGRGDALELLLRGKSTEEHWISPDTRASRLAPYLAEWKRKVERVGTLNFPSAARRQGLSGSPVLEVEIAADGRLRSARVRRSSGYGALDQAALTILRLASPFNPFPADVAADFSRLRFAYQWDFVAGNLQGTAARPDDADAAPAETAGVPAAAAAAPGSTGDDN
jgi:protein TonB